MSETSSFELDQSHAQQDRAIDYYDELLPAAPHKSSVATKDDFLRCAEMVMGMLHSGATALQTSENDTVPDNFSASYSSTKSIDVQNLGQSKDLLAEANLKLREKINDFVYQVDQLEEKAAELQQRDKELSFREEKVSRIEEQAARTAEELKRREDEIQAREQFMTAKNEELQSLKDQLERERCLLDEKDRQIEELNTRHQADISRANELQAQLAAECQRHQANTERVVQLQIDPKHDQERDLMEANSFLIRQEHWFKQGTLQLADLSNTDSVPEVASVDDPSENQVVLRAQSEPSVSPSTALKVITAVRNSLPFISSSLGNFVKSDLRHYTSSPSLSHAQDKPADTILPVGCEEGGQQTASSIRLDPLTPFQQLDTDIAPLTPLFSTRSAAPSAHLTPQKRKLPVDFDVIRTKRTKTMEEYAVGNMEQFLCNPYLEHGALIATDAPKQLKRKLCEIADSSPSPSKRVRPGNIFVVAEEQSDQEERNATFASVDSSDRALAEGQISTKGASRRGGLTDCDKVAHEDDCQAVEDEAAEVETGADEAGDAVNGNVEAGDVEAGDVEAGDVEAGDVDAGDVEIDHEEDDEHDAEKLSLINFTPAMHLQYSPSLAIPGQSSQINTQTAVRHDPFVSRSSSLLLEQSVITPIRGIILPVPTHDLNPLLVQPGDIDQSDSRDETPIFMSAPVHNVDASPLPRLEREQLAEWDDIHSGNTVEPEDACGGSDNEADVAESEDEERNADEAENEDQPPIQCDNTSLGPDTIIADAEGPTELNAVIGTDLNVDCSPLDEAVDVDDTNSNDDFGVNEVGEGDNEPEQSNGRRSIRQRKSARQSHHNINSEASEGYPEQSTTDPKPARSQTDAELKAEIWNSYVMAGLDDERIQLVYDSNSLLQPFNISMKSNSVKRPAVLTDATLDKLQLAVERILEAFPSTPDRRKTRVIKREAGLFRLLAGQEEAWDNFGKLEDVAIALYHASENHSDIKLLAQFDLTTALNVMESVREAEFSKVRDRLNTYDYQVMKALKCIHFVLAGLDEDWSTFHIFAAIYLQRGGVTRLLKLFSPIHIPAAVRLLRNAMNDEKFKASVIPGIAAAMQAISGEVRDQDDILVFDSPLARVQKRLRKFIPPCEIKRALFYSPNYTEDLQGRSRLANTKRHTLLTPVDTPGNPNLNTANISKPSVLEPILELAQESPLLERHMQRRRRVHGR